MGRKKEKKETKIGRNNPCYCGSGKKYKRCCMLNKVPEREGQELETIIEEHQKKLQIHQLNQKRKESKFGKVRDIIHTDFQDHKMVVVDNQLHYSKNWKTFPDFLMNYPGSVLGKDWGNVELKKPYENQHEILKWYVGACNYINTGWDREDKDGIKSGIPDGFAAAFLRLSYDLYILRDHSALQKKVINRLKNKDQFQGARHELFVAASFIRAGFDIDYEDESDKTKNHPEFIAKHKKTGDYISVEAKSRHRPGILGFPGKQEGESQIKLGARRLLNKAFVKDTKYPYAIFIDLNIPPVQGKIEQKPWFRDLWNSVFEDGGPTEENPDKFNILLFSNHPEHYGKTNKPCPPNEVIAVISKKPSIQMKNPNLLFEIKQVANQYGNIPNFFPKDWYSGEIESL